MRYLALATDYDGTLAHDGVVAPEVIEALEQLRHSGRRLILATGREIPDLQSVFDRLDLFDRIVAENGALLYNPASHEKKLLAQRPPDRFIERLRERGVPGMSVGEVVVALWRPWEHEALDAIRDFGLELEVIFNKDAVMVLPSGINKMAGLTAALKEMKISRHNVVGVGDAENDHAFLGCCECSVVVANAIPALKERADFITKRSRGDGVIELIRKLLDNDLYDLTGQLQRHGILLGKADGRDLALSPHGNSVLVCGQSGSGKSTMMAGLVERAIGKAYQICVVDPEGDYSETPGFLATGDTKHAPSLDHLDQMLDDPEAQVCVNLVGVRAPDRAEVFTRVLALAQERRTRTGRPHWLIVDEAHHMLPSEWVPTPGELSGESGNIVLITVHAGHVAPKALQFANVVIAVGRDHAELIREYARVAGVPAPDIPAGQLAAGEAFVWFRETGEVIPRVVTEPPREERNRHKRKYAEGQIEEDRVFYFRGPEKKLNLRVPNLMTFVQIAEGIDDDTWTFHLKQGDYSKWFRAAVKDAELADRVEAVERDETLPPAESRKRINSAIEEKYIAPA